MQIWNSAALLAIIILYFKYHKTDFMFSSVAVEVEFSTSWFSLSKLRYKKKINDKNSGHVETIDLWNQKKPQQMKGKNRVTIN